MISATLGNGILDRFVAQAGTAESPANIYAGLWIGDPGHDGQGGAEVAAAGYARIIANVWAGAAANRVITNTAPLVFGIASVSWGKPDYLALWSDLSLSTAAKFLVAAKLNPVVCIDALSQPTYGIGTLHLIIQ